MDGQKIRRFPPGPGSDARPAARPGGHPRRCRRDAAAQAFVDRFGERAQTATLPCCRPDEDSLRGRTVDPLRINSPTSSITWRPVGWTRCGSPSWCTRRQWTQSSVWPTQARTTRLKVGTSVAVCRASSGAGDQTAGVARGPRARSGFFQVFGLRSAIPAEREVFVVPEGERRRCSTVAAGAALGAG